jgi:hypothetical protein
MESILNVRKGRIFSIRLLFDFIQPRALAGASFGSATSTLPIAPEDHGSTGDTQRRTAPTGFRPALHLQQSWFDKVPERQRA